MPGIIAVQVGKHFSRNNMKARPTFSELVRKYAREVPAGQVTTYGMLARAAGAGGQAARSITSILSKDSDPSTIPFHRIVYSSGHVWKNERCESSRMKQYKAEEIPVDKNGRITNFHDILYTFGMEV